MPVYPRGGGCCEFGGSKPIGDGGIVLDLKQMDKIINLDESVVVLFGVKSEEAKILFACSRALSYDMNGLIREAGKFIEGRGGGAPNFAQAGGKKAEGIEGALNFALEHFQEFIKK